MAGSDAAHRIARRCSRHGRRTDLARLAQLRKSLRDFLGVCQQIRAVDLQEVNALE
jgi:hypothetical protein